MDLMGFIMGAGWLSIILAVLIIATLAYFLVLSRWKKAKGNQVLVVSGTGKGVRVYDGGGKFVSPFEAHATFSTSVLSLNGDGKEAPTKPKVQVVVNWNAQVRPDRSSDDQLIRAYQDFYGEYSREQIIKSLEDTLTGELRNVIGEMTPEELLHEKESFNQRVTEGASKRMKELGFELVNLNLADVTDNNDYFRHMATAELEDKREAAANIEANAKKNIAVVQAEATRASEDARITSELAVDERKRDAAIQRAGYKAEEDVAQADANVAGELRSTERAKEVAANRGAVAVVEAEQDEKAAAAQRAAALTRAETERQKDVIEAQGRKDQDEIAASAEARRAEIDAEAKANVAKRNAEGAAQAEEARAKGVANAKRETAAAEADAINATAKAKADEIRETGLASAEVERAKGEAEAAAILARGKAEAEAERELAEARAAHGGVNKEIEIAKINATARVEIATAYGAAMHEVGKNVTILQTGGGNAGGGNLLTNLLGGLPGLAKELDVQSEVLNGTSFNEVLAGLVNSIKGNAPAVIVPGEVVDTTNGGLQLPEGVTLDSLAEVLGVDTTDIVKAAQSLEVPASDGEIAVTDDSE